MAKYESTIQDDISLYYEDRGVGKTVVFLHGFCGSHAYWKYVLEELSSYYRVIAIDLRGHGKSAVPEESSSIEDMAHDVELLLHQLQIEKATIIGHSLGGYITLALVEKNAELVDGFGLIHSTAAPDSEEAKNGRDSVIARICGEGIKGFINDLSTKLFSPRNLDRLKGEFEFVKKLGYQTTVKGAEASLEAMKNRKDRQSVLEDSTCPILLVAGKEDQIIPPEKTFTIDGPHVRQVLLNESGHMGMLEEPQVLLDALHQFLLKVETSKSNGS